MDTQLSKIINDRVFQDAPHGDIEPCIDRCRRDSRYLQRRAEDLKIAPLLLLHRLQADMADKIISREVHTTHTIIEVGLPAYRIGACVLSDLASYTGDDLPLSFWLAHWPSPIAFVEHMEETEESAAQQKLMRLMGRFLSKGLKYIGTDSIIKSSLE